MRTSCGNTIVREGILRNHKIPVNNPQDRHVTQLLFSNNEWTAGHTHMGMNLSSSWRGEIYWSKEKSRAVLYNRSSISIKSTCSTGNNIKGELDLKAEQRNEMRKRFSIRTYNIV